MNGNKASLTINKYKKKKQKKKQNYFDHLITSNTEVETFYNF